MISEQKIITVNDLYNISNCFKTWKNADDIKISSIKPINVYSINVKAKKRYINPLVQINNI